MGYPVDSYTLMAALLGDPELQLAHDDANQLRESFNLFGFVLFDPEAHRELSDTLERDFDVLDELTGSKFLFFALVASERARMERYAPRTHFHTLRDALRDRDAGRAPDRPAPRLVSPVGREGADTKRELGTLLIHLGLTAADLPCIAITSDLRGASAVFLPTSARELMGQLQGLARVAHCSSELGAEELVREIVALHLDRAGPPLESAPEVHFARALRDATCFLEDLENADFLVRPAIEARRATLVRELEALWVEARQGLDEERLLELAERWMTALAASQRAPRVAEYPFTAAREWVEAGTWDVLCAASEIRGLFVGDTDRDCSPIVACLAKGFEREMNLVPLQWARREGGIPMPEYWGRVCPNRAVHVDTGRPPPVDLNAQDRHRRGLRFLQLGDGYHVLNRLRPRRPADWPEADYARFLRAWRRFGVLRNDSVHGAVKLDREALDEAERLALTAFGNQSDDQARLGQLKHELRGD